MTPIQNQDAAGPGSAGLAADGRPRDDLPPVTFPDSFWELVVRRATGPDASRPLLLDDLGRQLTGADLRARAERIAAGLWARGVRPGTVVSWQLPTSLEAALDAEAFDADGFFRTGDLGVIGPRGHVRITGRRKDVIIRNAENISAPEVEGILAGHPAVADVAVIGLPDPRTGERCCAVVVVRPDAAPPTLADLADHCVAAGLARHKIPERLELVDELPRSGLGKVAKAQLRARFAAEPAERPA